MVAQIWQMKYSGQFRCLIYDMVVNCEINMLSSLQRAESSVHETAVRHFMTNLLHSERSHFCEFIFQ